MKVKQNHPEEQRRETGRERTEKREGVRVCAQCEIQLYKNELISRDRYYYAALAGLELTV